MTNNNYPVDLPKTYTVAYFDEAEWNKTLTQDDLKNQEIINDSYKNEINSQEKGYGPCDSSSCPYNNRFYLKIVMVNEISEWKFTKIYSSITGSREFFD